MQCRQPPPPTNSSGSQIRPAIPQARVFHPYQTEQRHPRTFNPPLTKNLNERIFNPCPPSPISTGTPIRVPDSVTLAQRSAQLTYIIHPSTPNSIRRRRIIYIPIPSHLRSPQFPLLAKKEEEEERKKNPAVLGIQVKCQSPRHIHPCISSKPTIAQQQAPCRLSLLIHFCFVYITTPLLTSQTNPFCFSLLLLHFSKQALLPFALAHQELWLLCIGAHLGIIQVRPTQPRRKSCLVYSSKLACLNPRQILNRRFVYCSQSR